MNHSRKKGFSFGLTSGIITTLGMIVGLHSGTHSRLVVLGGIFIIAVADALSDSMGMHISEEFEFEHSPREIWESTLTTFIAKFFFAGTFIVPFLLFELETGIIVSLAWGISLIGLFSYYMAKHQGIAPVRVIAEHVITTIAVIVATHLIGTWVAATFA